MYLKSFDCYIHFFICNKMYFALILDCIHGVGTTRRIHQVSLFPVYVGQPCRQAILCSIQMVNKIYFGTRFSQRCITFSRKFGKDSIAASAFRGKPGIHSSLLYQIT